MLRKLLKYDLLASLRIFALGWLGILLLTGVQCLLLSLDMENTLVVVLVVLSAIPYVLGMIAMFSLPNIYFGIRFYRGLLGKEGYLMFTLPTQPWKLLTSKLLSALIITAASYIVTISAIVAWISCLFNAMGEGYGFLQFAEVLTWDWNILWTVVNVIISWIANNLMLYMACCLGHLFHSRRGVWAVVMYFAMNTAMSTVLSVTRAFQTYDMAYSSYQSFGSLMNYTMWSTAPLYLAVSILCFFFCERIMRNKLNLE